MDRTTPSRRKHVLYGDATGGGHLWPGLPGKTPFPQDWAADQIMQAISDVAVDPASMITAGRGGRLLITGTRDGVDIRVIVDARGEIIAGYPINLPRNP